MRAVVHDFAERLRWSGDLSTETAWVNLYREMWPNLICAVRIDADCVQQRHGVDRVIYLPTGREIKIDEKKRERDYGDFLCEIGSCDRWDEQSRRPVGRGRIGIGSCDRWDEQSRRPVGRGRIGWTLDTTKQCDFIAYAVIPAKICYLLPFELLRLTAKTKVEAWKREPNAYPRRARNNGYETISVSVPWDRLWSDMRDTSMRRVSGSLTLPEPVEVVEGQLVFHWPV